MDTAAAGPGHGSQYARPSKQQKKASDYYEPRKSNRDKLQQHVEDRADVFHGRAHSTLRADTGTPRKNKNG